MGEIVAARVAILASGGMSHYPGTWRYPQPEFAFDQWVISELERGKGQMILCDGGGYLH